MTAGDDHCDSIGKHGQSENEEQRAQIGEEIRLVATGKNLLDRGRKDHCGLVECGCTDDEEQRGQIGDAAYCGQTGRHQNVCENNYSQTGEKNHLGQTGGEDYFDQICW